MCHVKSIQYHYTIIIKEKAVVDREFLHVGQSDTWSLQFLQRIWPQSRAVSFFSSMQIEQRLKINWSSIVNRSSARWTKGHLIAAAPTEDVATVKGCVLLFVLAD